MSYDPEKQIEEPFANGPDRWEQITAGMLIEMLQSVPKDYEIKFDSACGQIMKGDFTIYHKNKEVSLNG